MLLQELTGELFEQHVGETFSITGASAPIHFTLIGANIHSTGNSAASGRKPFSIIFRGPLDPPLSQAIYPLAHPGLGELEIFLVPVGADESGMRYEAVFS
jgi:hypothetical protein